MSGDHAGVLMPPPLLFVLPLGIAALLDSQWSWLISGTFEVPLVLGGVVLAAIGVAIGLASVYSFGRARTTILPAGRPTTAIVEGGPYRFTRNPMYLAMACAYVGLSLSLNNAWAILLLPPALAVIDRSVIAREERYLASKFGEPYRDYCGRVRRWL